MISRIRGTLLSLAENTAEIDLGGGLTFEVLLPAYLSARVAPQIGKPVEFITLTYLEGQGQGSSFIPRLIGFAHDSERRFFDVFTTVKGIGNKKALRALTVEPAAIARAVMSRDAKSLQQLPEIGKRLAETMIAELHGKVDRFLSPMDVGALNHASEIKPFAKTSAAQEAIGALVALGETPATAERKVALVMDRTPGKALTSDEIVSAVYAG